MEIGRILLRVVEESSLLHRFLNSSAVEILKTNESSMTPKNLSNLIVNTIQVQTMLENQATRNIIIRKMKDKEAEEFARFIGVKSKGNIHNTLRNTKFSKKMIIKSLEFFNKEYEEAPIIYRPDEEESEIPIKSLFQYQIMTVKEARQHLATSPRKALLHMPTGSGKTRSAMRIVAMHLLSDPTNLVIWLAHNGELCEYAAQEFQEMWHAVGDRKIKTYRFFGNSKLDFLKIKGGFVAASLQKMVAQAHKDNTFLSKVGAVTNLVVIDEAHQATADKYSIVIEELAASKQTGLLGLSATPGRTSTNLDMETRKLAKFFAKNKVTLDTGKENPVSFLINNGYLANPKFVQVKSPTKLSKRDIATIAVNNDVPISILQKISKDTMRNMAILDEIARLTQKHKKIIVFASSIEHAQTISILLSSEKYRSRITHDSKTHRSHYITSKTPGGIRKIILNEYRKSDDPMILCNFGILTTGFDAPRTSAVVIARPTKSYVLYAQMVGRGIRGPKAGGNRSCEVATVIDEDIQEFINIERIFTRWEGSWDGKTEGL